MADRLADFRGCLFYVHRYCQFSTALFEGLDHCIRAGGGIRLPFGRRYEATHVILPHILSQSNRVLHPSRIEEEGSIDSVLYNLATIKDESGEVLLQRGKAGRDRPVLVTETWVLEARGRVIEQHVEGLISVKMSASAWARLQRDVEAPSEPRADRITGPGVRSYEADGPHRSYATAPSDSFGRKRPGSGFGAASTYRPDEYESYPLTYRDKSPFKSSNNDNDEPLSGIYRTPSFDWRDYTRRTASCSPPTAAHPVVHSPMIGPMPPPPPLARSHSRKRTRIDPKDAERARRDVHKLNTTASDDDLDDLFSPAGAHHEHAEVGDKSKRAKEERDPRKKRVRQEGRNEDVRKEVGDSKSGTVKVEPELSDAQALEALLATERPGRDILVARDDNQNHDGSPHDDRETRRVDNRSLSDLGQAEGVGFLRDGSAREKIEINFPTSDPTAAKDFDSYPPSKAARHARPAAVERIGSTSAHAKVIAKAIKKGDMHLGRRRADGLVIDTSIAVPATACLSSNQSVTTAFSSLSPSSSRSQARRSAGQVDGIGEVPALVDDDSQPQESAKHQGLPYKPAGTAPPIDDTIPVIDRRNSIGIKHERATRSIPIRVQSPQHVSFLATATTTITASSEPLAPDRGRGESRPDPTVMKDASGHGYTVFLDPGISRAHRMLLKMDNVDTMPNPEDAMFIVLPLEQGLTAASDKHVALIEGIMSETNVKARGRRMVVSHAWLDECFEAGKVVDARPFRVGIQRK